MLSSELALGWTGCRLAIGKPLMGLFGNAIQGTVFPFKSSRAQTLPFAGEESVSVSCEILSVVYKRTFRNLMLVTRRSGRGCSGSPYCKSPGRRKKFGCLCSSKATTWELWWPAVTLQGYALTWIFGKSQLWHKRALWEKLPDSQSRVLTESCFNRNLSFYLCVDKAA